MATRRFHVPLLVTAALAGFGACTFGAEDYQVFIVTDETGGTGPGGAGNGGAGATDCDAGDYDDDGDASTPCVAWTECVAGEYVKTEGTADSDTECAACDDQTFSDAPGAASCKPWNECSTSLARASGSAKSDAVCEGQAWQMGSSGSDTGIAVAVDADGSVVIVGHVTGALPGQTALGNRDVFVRKFDPEGEEAWTRQFGTSGVDQPHGVGLDADGNVFVVGSISSAALPEQTALGLVDAFVRKYDKNGVEEWTRQFGTGEDDQAFAVATDADGNVFIAGNTEGALGAPNQGGDDVFLRRYSADGTAAWTEQFGTAGEDGGFSLVVRADNLDVAGTTNGTFSGETSAGGTDVFVRRFDLAGDVQWTEQLGTSGIEQIAGVTSDTDGNAFVAGYTGGTFAGQSTSGGFDAFLARIDSTGARGWTRQFGTASAEYATSVVGDGTGNVYVVGSSEGTFPGETNVGGGDVFIAKYTSEGSSAWVHTFGTATSEVTYGAAYGAGRVFATGLTSGAFPGRTNAGGTDAILLSVVP